MDIQLKVYASPEKRKPVMSTIEVVSTQSTIEYIDYEGEAEQLFKFLHSSISSGTYNALRAKFLNGYVLDPNRFSK
jgi:hypothetical protein